MTTLDMKKRIPSKEEVIDRCGFELATNFEKPAKSILAFWGFFLGISGEKMGELMKGAS